VAARLDERFRFLTGGRRTAVERHQTLRATVLNGLASFRALGGDSDQARQEADEALQVSREVQSPTFIANTLHAVGWAWYRIDPERALRALEEAAELIAGVMSLMATIRRRADDLDGATSAIRASVAWAVDVVDRPQFLAAMNNYPKAPKSHGAAGIARIAAALGTERYQRAAARGAAMSFAERAAFVIRDIDTT
jgi:hypothetical protein